MENYMTYLWILVIIVSLVVEAGTYALIAIWFVPSAAICIVLSMFDMNISAQVIVFFLLSLISIIIFRKYFQNIIKSKAVFTNADAVIGKTGIVTEDIDNINFKGQVKVGYQIWTAIASDSTRLKKGDTVKVLSIEGVKLIVEKAESEVIK